MHSKQLEKAEFYQAFAKLVPTTMGTIFANLAMQFAYLGAIVRVQTETMNGMKRLQFVYGVRPWLYWLVQFVWDFAAYAIVAGTAGLLLTVVPNALEGSVREMLYS